MVSWLGVSYGIITDNNCHKIPRNKIDIYVLLAIYPLIYLPGKIVYFFNLDCHDHVYFVIIIISFAYCSVLDIAGTSMKLKSKIVKQSLAPVFNEVRGECYIFLIHFLGEISHS